MRLVLSSPAAPLHHFVQTVGRNADERGSVQDRPAPPNFAGMQNRYLHLAPRDADVMWMGRCPDRFCSLPVAFRKFGGSVWRRAHCFRICPPLPRFSLQPKFVKWMIYGGSGEPPSEFSLQPKFVERQRRKRSDANLQPNAGQASARDGRLECPANAR